MRKRWLCGLLVLAMLLGLTSGIPVRTAAAGTTSNMKVSAQYIEMLKKMEGFYAKPYYDYKQYTIGYGTRCPDELVAYYTANPMSKEEAEEWLYREMPEYETPVNQLIDRYGLKLEQHQFDALVSFSYNCGPNWTTDVGGYFHTAVVNGDMSNLLIYGMCLWSTAGGEYSLIHRRMCEANLYINGVYKAYNEGANPSATYPSTYKYIFLNGNGGTQKYAIHGYNAADPMPVITNFKEIPVGVDENGEPFFYEFAGWYTRRVGGEKIETLDGSLPNGATIYAQWKNPKGEIEILPKGEAITPLEVTVKTDGVSLRQGAGTGFDVVGTANQGDKLTITATATVSNVQWGRFDGGWIRLQDTNYSELMSQIPESQSKWGTVITSGVNVRVGPGTNYDRVKLPDGNDMQKGTGERVEIFETTTSSDGLNWGKMADGNWICLTYVKFDEVVSNPTLESISIAKQPDKLIYSQGDYLDTQGSVMLLHYSDGSVKARTVYREYTSGYDNQKLGTQTITVTCSKKTATYQITVKGRVEFRNYDGALLQSTQHDAGEVPVPPADPTRPADDVGTYVFAGWDKEIAACSGNAVYTAVYELIPFQKPSNTITVTKLPDKLTYLQGHETLDLTGAQLTAEHTDGTTSVLDITDKMVSGFDNMIAGTQTITVTYGDVQTTFEVTVVKPTITFVNYDGTVISEIQCGIGETVTPPADPEKPAGGNGPYVFTGWNTEIKPCTGNATYTAEYKLQYAYGDCNFDGVVSEDDAIYLLWHAFFPEEHPVEVSVDYNGDGTVNEDDAIYLLWHAFFPEEHPLVTAPET